MYNSLKAHIISSQIFLANNIPKKILRVQMDSENSKLQEQQSLLLSKEQKICLLNELIAQLSDKPVAFRQNEKNYALDYTVSYQPIVKIKKLNNLNNYRDHVFTYQIPGSKIMRKSQNSNLQMKLFKFQHQRYNEEQANNNGNLTDKKQEQENPQNHNQRQQKQELSNQEKISDNQEEVQNNNPQNQLYRYYKDNVKCFKCNKSGHYKTSCPQQDHCMFCLSTGHESEQCPQKNVCYRCYKFGHMLSQCKKRDIYSQKCMKCERNHDGECMFLTKGKQRTKKMFRLDKIYYDPQIMCAKCFEYGHVSCN